MAENPRNNRMSKADYLIISQDTTHVDHHMRDDDGICKIDFIEGGDATLRMQSINCEIMLADLYENVTFETTELPDID